MPIEYNILWGRKGSDFGHTMGNHVEIT